MSLNHGINTYKSDTNFAVVKTAAVGIPFFIGAWPCHQAGGFVDKPQQASTYNEAVKLGGFSYEWRNDDNSPKWNLCQAVYSHFKLFNVSPAVFYNVYNPAKHKTAVSATSFDVSDHIATLSEDAILDDSFTVTSGDNTLVSGTDYDAYYDDNVLYVELLTDSSYYDVTTLTVAYNEANPAAITAADIAEAVEKIEECKAVLGIVPDLICAPGWSSTPSVAAVMAAKAESINGLYRATAVVDIDTSADGAPAYSDVLTWKNSNGYTDEYMLCCWPMALSGDYLFDMSTIVCGQIASVDSDNADVPYESPSNKSLSITGLCTIDGTEINLSLPQADTISYTDGVVTAINNGGWVLWGNYLACWPSSSDVAKYFICTKRMQDYICNTFIDTFWSFLDKPLTRPLIDAIVNSFNSWLNGLTHENKLYGGELQYVADNNTTAALVNGQFRLDCVMASPVPAQQINMYVTYDVDLITEALSA